MGNIPKELIEQLKRENGSNTNLASQIEFIQSVNQLFRTPLFTSIENSLKELKSIKNKSIEADYLIHNETGKIGKVVKTPTIKLQSGELFTAPAEEFNKI